MVQVEVVVVGLMRGLILLNQVVSVPRPSSLLASAWAKVMS